MKKNFLKKVVTSMFLFALVLGTISTVSALTYSKRVHTFRYDRNTYTNVLSNYHNYTYIDVPDPSILTSQTEKVVGSGWNYIRMEVTNHYTMQ